MTGMMEAYLVPEKTVVTTRGNGPVVDIRNSESRLFLLQLEIARTVEQESIDVSVSGGPDEGNIGKVALASIPQQFYTGSYPLLLDLTAVPSVSVLQAHWEVNRWGRGPEQPWFEFSLKLTEVTAEMTRTLNHKSR